MSYARRIQRDQVLDLIKEAKVMATFYDTANKEHPKRMFDYGTVDEVALKLFEAQQDFIATGIKLHGSDVKVFGRRGRLMPDGDVVLVDGNTEYVFRGFDESTTISRFVHSLCDVLDRRYQHGTPQLRGLMPENERAYTARTRREVLPHC